MNQLSTLPILSTQTDWPWLCWNRKCCAVEPVPPNSPWFVSPHCISSSACVEWPYSVPRHSRQGDPDSAACTRRLLGEADAWFVAWAEQGRTSGPTYDTSDHSLAARVSRGIPRLYFYTRHNTDLVKLNVMMPMRFIYFFHTSSIQCLKTWWWISYQWKIE